MGGNELSKLDWSRASLRIADPARVQRSEDRFVTSVKPKSKKTKKKMAVGQPTAAQAQRLRAHEIRMTNAKAEKKKKAVEAQFQKANQKVIDAEAKAARRTKSANDQKLALSRKKLKAEKKKALADERRAAFAEYQKTPEYAKKLENEKKAMAAKMKSHLQVWIEQHTNLDRDREELRKQWRRTLIPNRMP